MPKDRQIRHIRIEMLQPDYEALEEVKGNRTWREAMLEEFGVDE